MEGLLVALVIITMETESALNLWGPACYNLPVIAVATWGNTIIRCTWEEDFHHQVNLPSSGSVCACVWMCNRHVAGRVFCGSNVYINPVQLLAHSLPAMLTRLWPNRYPARNRSGVDLKHTHTHTHADTYTWMEVGSPLHTNWLQIYSVIAPITSSFLDLKLCKSLNNPVQKYVNNGCFAETKGRINILQH